MWYRNWDDQPFETEEAARKAAREEMIYEDYQYGHIDFEKVLKWCFEQDGFVEAFADELNACEEYYFQNNFTEEKD